MEELWLVIFEYWKEIYCPGFVCGFYSHKLNVGMVSNLTWAITTLLHVSAFHTASLKI